jgi:Tfp pilus assembly protein PilW
MRDEKGFTLVELMVAAGIAMGLLVAVYMAVNSTQRHSSAIERRVTAQQDLKPALDLMAMEIGMASYNPNAVSGIWCDPTTCAGGDVTYRGIQEATANSIVVEMDIDDSGAVGDFSNEIIRYEYLSGASDLRITRETIRCASGTRTTSNPLPFLGDTVAGQKTIRVINDTLGIPVFRYYDGTGAEIVAGNGSDNLPLAIPNIRRIEIVLAVETEFNDANTGQPKSLIYSTSVIPRNHAIQ